jgi:hypothetical protein
LIAVDVEESGAMAVNSDVAAARALLIAAIRRFEQHAVKRRREAVVPWDLDLTNGGPGD